MSVDAEDNSIKTARVIGVPFVKGVSGNLNGRPKGTRNIQNIFKDAMYVLAEQSGTTVNEIETKLAKVGLDKAMEGDHKFWESIQDRMHGKAIQRTENLNANVNLNKLDDESKGRLSDLLNE